MTACRLCGSTKVQIAFSFPNHSIVHHLKDSPHESGDFSGPFNLHQCMTCGFLFSKDYFAPKNYLYDNYLTLSSAKPQPHAHRLIEMLRMLSLKSNPSIFEIGCNDGSFIKLLAQNKFSEVAGIEPAKDAFSEAYQVSRNIINDFFSSKLSSDIAKTGQYDVVVTRQVLEHISELHDFLEGVKKILQHDGILVIEVPDQTMNFMQADYSFWEEHINYFTINTLSQLLRCHGFYIFHSETIMFSGQALTVYCKNINKSKSFEFYDYDHALREKYINQFSSFKSELKDYLTAQRDRYKEIYIYGAGCRSLCLVDFIDIGNLISGFIDDAGDKSNKFSVGSSLPILEFDEKHMENSFFLLGVNSEIEARLIASRMLPADRLHSILPPSRRLPDFWQKYCIW